MLEGYPGHLLYIQFPSYGIAYAILLLNLRASMSLVRRRYPIPASCFDTTR